MADSKVSNLSDVGTITSDMLLYVVASPGSTPASRKGTVAELQTFGVTSGNWWNAVVAASDQDISSQTTVQNDNELFFTMVANKLYLFEIYIIYSSPAGSTTPDFKWQFTIPATATGQYTLDSSYLSLSDASGTAQSGVGPNATNAVGTAATPRLVTCHGWMYSTAGGSGNAGFLLQWAQNTSNSNATRRHAGSILRYKQMST